MVYLPIVFLFFRGYRGLSAGLTAGFLGYTGIQVGFGSLEFLRYLLSGAAFGFLFVWLYRRKFPLFWVLTGCMIPELIFMGLTMATPHYRTAFFEAFTKSAELFDSSLNLPQNAEKLMELYKSRLVQFSELLMTVVATFVMSLLFYRAAGREKPGITKVTVPPAFIWILIGALVLVLLKPTETLGGLVLSGSLILYLLNGLAIIRTYFLKAGTTGPVEWICYIGFVFTFMLPPIVIGLLDTWVGFRQRIAEVRSNHNDNH